MGGSGILHLRNKRNFLLACQDSPISIFRDWSGKRPTQSPFVEDEKMVDRPIE
jgi:hypothetical protein